MRVAFPHLGNLYIGMHALFDYLGIESVVIPPPTPSTIQAALRYSPELCCLPFKINLADFIAALDKGADSLLMVTDDGPCRLGLYGIVQSMLLKQLNYSFDFLLFDYTKPINFIWQFKKLSQRSLIDVLYGFHFGLKKLTLCDRLRKMYLSRRANAPEYADKLYNEGIYSIEKAKTKDELHYIEMELFPLFDELNNNDKVKLYRVAVIGEIYMLLEPKCNFEIELQLTEFGISVERSAYLSDAIVEKLKKKRKGSLMTKSMAKATAKRYLRHWVGGECNLSVGYAMLYAQAGYDGLIHLLPFTCTPEMIARTILAKVSKDFNIPILSLPIDEHTQDTAIRTRLEAFVELIKRKKCAQVE